MAPFFYQHSTALVGEGEVYSSTWQRTLYARNISLLFTSNDTIVFIWSAVLNSIFVPSVSLHSCGLLYSSTCPVEQEEWFVLSCLSSHICCRTASLASGSYSWICPGNSRSDRLWSYTGMNPSWGIYLANWVIWKSSLSLKVYTCLQVSVCNERACNKTHCGADNWPSFCKAAFVLPERTINNHALESGSWCWRIK